MVSSSAVYEAGGHEMLIQQLSESSTSTVASSAATLCNMAEQEIIQSSILSQGGIQALVEPLQSTDTQVLMYTALCVAKLACNDEEREKFHKAGGLEPLVNLLYSKDKELLKHACLAVNVCAREISCAVKMCKLGALEILQKINQSANRSFSELAITSLLNSNLPVKYSRMGCLTPNDIVTSGFYDVGKAFLGQPFLTLEELINQPLNQKREIIAFNIPMEETVDLAEERKPRPTESLIAKIVGEILGHTISKRQEEEDNLDEEPHDVLPEKSPTSFGDVSLLMLIKKAKDSVLSLRDEREQYAALARLVSEAMGGAVPRERLHELSWMLHQSELRFQLKSNVLPIGMINKGTYCHRAFLFKCLADTIGKRCSLVRGDYNRAWNEVIIFKVDRKNLRFSEPRWYIVDLMHQPGTLLPIDSPAAEEYQTI